MLFIRIFFSVWLINVDLIENKIYPFNSENGKSVEFYDCLIIESLSYCRHPEESQDLIRNSQIVSCEKNGGKMHLFLHLHSTNVTSNRILHEWKSTVNKS